MIEAKTLDWLSRGFRRLGELLDVEPEPSESSIAHRSPETHLKEARHVVELSLRMIETVSKVEYEEVEGRSIEHWLIRAHARIDGIVWASGMVSEDELQDMREEDEWALTPTDPVFEKLRAEGATA